MITLPQELRELLEDREALKVLGTVDGKGVPHVVIKDSITLLSDGTLAYAEGLDSSMTNKNLVRAIWFDRQVSITIVKGEQCYQIKGKPFKCCITGPLYKEFLMREKQKAGSDNDIQSVWVITPLEVRNEARKIRKTEELQKDPFYNIHLDTLKAG